MNECLKFMALIKEKSTTSHHTWTCST